jgi:hypothetical protein
VSRVACKFLERDRVTPFARFRWPAPGEWVEVAGPLDPCRNGVHGVGREHLARWLQPELWRIELDGETVDVGSVVAARRGRLLERVDGWSPAVARELMENCIERGRQLAREHPESELVAGLAEHAEKFVQGPADSEEAFHAVATGSYVVARAAGGRASMEDPVAHEAAFDEERRRQSLWLAERLGLGE